MKRGAVLFIIGILAPWAGAATLRARPFTLEDVVAFRTIDDLRVSPDGKAVVFALTGARLEEGRYETDLYLVTLEDGGPARRLTFSDADDEMPRWSPDGRRIAFLSGRGGAKQVWVLRREGGEAEQVTGHPPQPIAWFDWAPDGRRMLVVAPPPESDDEAGRKKIKDDAVVVGRHWRNHRMWLAGAEAGGRPAALQPLTDGGTHIQKALWSPDGNRIAFLESPTPEADADEEAHLRVLEVAGGALLDVPDSLRASGEFAWSPDGRRLAFTAPFDGRGISRQDLFVWEAPDGTGAAASPVGEKRGLAAPGGRARNLSAALDRDIEAIRWTPDGGAVDVLYGRGIVHAVARLDGRAPARDVWTPGHVVELPQRGRTGWVYVRGDRPPEIRVAPDRGEGRALTAVNQATASIDLPEPEAYRWKGPGGTLEAVLVKPRGAKGPLPLVLRPHGGPRMHVNLAFDPSALYLASRGFLVLKVNFRGSTGYGDAFTRGNVGNWGDGPFADVMSGADALIRQGLADPERLFLYGWSYGGYLANWAATHTGRLRAIASGAGVADLRMQYVLSDARRWRFDYMSGSPFVDAHLAIYNRLSPITYAATARVPTLFLHGENDVRCPPAQGVMMHRALADRGVPTELVLYPREGHDFQEPRHILDRIRRVADWFDKHDRPAGKSR